MRRWGCRKVIMWSLWERQRLSWRLFLYLPPVNPRLCFRWSSSGFHDRRDSLSIRGKIRMRGQGILFFAERSRQWRRHFVLPCYWWVSFFLPEQMPLQIVRMRKCSASPYGCNPGIRSHFITSMRGHAGIGVGYSANIARALRTWQAGATKINPPYVAITPARRAERSRFGVRWNTLTPGGRVMMSRVISIPTPPPGPDASLINVTWEKWGERYSEPYIISN